MIFFHHRIKFVIPMALTQLEVLLVTLQRISCLLVSVRRKHLPVHSFPLSGGKSTMDEN